MSVRPVTSDPSAFITKMVGGATEDKSNSSASVSKLAPTASTKAMRGRSGAQEGEGCRVGLATREH